MIYSCSFLAEVNYKEVIDDSLKGLLASLKCMVDVLINLVRLCEGMKVIPGILELLQYCHYM